MIKIHKYLAEKNLHINKMVHPVGLEPATFWSVASSISLTVCIQNTGFTFYLVDLHLTFNAFCKDYRQRSAAFSKKVER